jgi:hypothetical protein
MTNLSNLTTSQLKGILAIKEQIEALQRQIDLIAGGGEIPIPAAEDAPAPARRKYHMTAAHKRKLIKALAKARRIRLAKIKGKANGKRRLTAAGRAAIVAGARARWARVKAAKKKDRRSSPAVRAKLAAAARARWARVRAEGKTTL